MSLELEKLQRAHAQAKIQEDEKWWYKKPQNLKIMCCDDPDKKDYVLIEDYQAQEEVTNMASGVVHISVLENDQHRTTTTSHLDLEGMIKLRDFLSKRIDYHGTL